jgi:hypothetical protein
MDAQCRHESGDAVEQLKRSEDQRGTGPGRTGLGALVEQVFAIQFTEPFHGEWRAGAVTQQTRAPRAVSGLDAHRGVDGEATVEVFDAGIDWAVLITGYSEQALTHLAVADPDNAQLTRRGAANVTSAVYAMDYSLTCAELTDERRG